VATTLITAEVAGVREWKRALNLRLWRTHKATLIATRDSLRSLERDIKIMLRRHTHAPGTPTTSPPGEPPALVSGALSRSVRSEGPWPGRRPWQTVGAVGPTIIYSRAHELGYRPGRLPKRPYQLPATKAARPSIRQLYVQRWTQALS
jgi:hypothetical protein